MNWYDQPDNGRKVTRTSQIGNYKFLFESFIYKGDPIALDTNVSVNGSYLCIITWAEIDNFLTEIREAYNAVDAVIHKYSI